MVKSELSWLVWPQGPSQSSEWKLREINSTQFMDEPTSSDVS